MKNAMEVEITDAFGDDQMELVIRGSVAAVIKMLVRGMPPAAVFQIRDAMQAELDKRSDEAPPVSSPKGSGEDPPCRS